MEQTPGLSAPVRTEKGFLQNAEVFDAEVVAINQVAKRAARGRPTETRLYSDNLIAVTSCKHRPAPSSQAEAIEVQDILRKRKNITLHWCLGHTGVTGNEAVNKAAKKASTQPTWTDHGHPHWPGPVPRRPGPKQKGYVTAGSPQNRTRQVCLVL